MATREELLNEYESKLNGFIIRCDAFKHPATGALIKRNKDKQHNMPDLRSAIIEVEESPDGASVLERHITFWWDKDQDVKGNVQFYVLNRGQPDEEAVWLKAQDPKPAAPEQTFQQKTLAWLRSKVGQTVGPYTIKHVSGVTADQEAKTATAQVLVAEAGALKWINVHLWLDEANAVQWEVIPAAV